MAESSPTEAEHLLLRRFDPDDVDHYSFDERLGRKRFRSGAFRWDADETGPREYLGCSVHDDFLLEQASIARLKVVRAPYLYVAGAVADDVRAVGAPDSSPFNAVQDPYPDGQQGAEEIDQAHALITRPVRLKDKWMSRLALRFALVPLTR